MMAKLKAVLDSLDGLDESVAGLYAKGDDGKYRLDAEGVEDVSGLKSALEKEKRTRKELADRLAKLPDDFDPDEFEALRSAKAKAERDDLEKKGKWDALEKQLIEKHQKALDKEAAEKQRYRAALEEHLLDAEAIRALADQTHSPALMLPHVRKHMRVLEEQGKFVARIVDGDGNVRVGKGQGSAPMTLSELLDEMRVDKDYAPAFKGTGSSGGGATRSAGGAGGGGGIIAASDRQSFMANIDSIADGKMKVATDQ